MDYSKKGAHIVKATKKLVDDLIERNTNNRSIKSTQLGWIKGSLDRGEFMLTAQGIAVSNEGVLLDGQHRLLAIQEAGYPPVELLIVTGLEDKSKIYIDQNAKRSTSDMLKIVLNQSISNRMSSIVTTHLKIDIRKDGIFMGKTGRLPLESVVETMTEYAEVIERLIAAGGNVPRAGSYTAFLHYAIKYNEEAAIELLHQVRTGEMLESKDPAYRLRGFLLGTSKRTLYGSEGQLNDYKHTISACIAHANKEDLASLRPSNGWAGLPKKIGRYRVSEEVGKLVKTVTADEKKKKAA